MAALSAALDEAYAVLKANPADTKAALDRARVQVAKYFTAEETAAFQLWSGGGEWMIYIPTSAHASTVWLARTTDHLVVEPSGLPADARALVGL